MVIIYVYDSYEDTRPVIRKIVRPLLALECKVYIAGVDSGFIGKHNAEKLLAYVIEQEKGKTLQLIADGMAGKQLFIAATLYNSPEIDKLIVRNIQDSWPFEELSPLNYVTKLNVPAVFVYEESERPGRLHGELQKAGKEIAVYIMDSTETLPLALSAGFAEREHDNELQVYPCELNKK